MYLQAIVTYDTPSPRQKLDFLKSGDLESLKPLPHSTQMPRGQHRRPQQFFWKRFIGSEWITVIDTNGFRRMKEEGHICKAMPQIFKFLPRDLLMIFQSLVVILPRFFRLWKTITKSLGKN